MGRNDPGIAKGRFQISRALHLHFLRVPRKQHLLTRYNQERILEIGPHKMWLAVVLAIIESWGSTKHLADDIPAACVHSQAQPVPTNH